MKKFIALSSWSLKAIGFILILSIVFAACGDNGSSAPQDDGAYSSVCDDCDESSSSKVKSGSSSKDVMSGDSRDGSSDSKSSSSESGRASSSLVISDGWSWDVPKETHLNSEITYGTMTDERDGKTYKTVTIAPEGSGYSGVWMAENLNYYDATAMRWYEKERSWCYGKSDNEDSTTCDVAGRLYAWGAVDCPSGWHEPSKYEWDDLFKAVGGQSIAGKILKSQTGWNNNGNGTDAFGFSALPAGDRENGDSFFLDGYFAYFWTSTGTNIDEAYYISLNYYEDAASLNVENKKYAFSVRCVKDGSGVVKSSSSSVVKSSSSSNTKSSSSSVDVPSSSSKIVVSSSSSKIPEPVEVSSSSVANPADWSWDVSKETRFNPEIEYDTIIDSRDGKVYKTVKIGDQTWMAENLNYYDAMDGSVRGNSWCFGKSDNKDSSTCDVTGRLYTWAAAIDSATLYREKSINCGYGGNCKLLPDTVYGICPSGWHLPSYREWKGLFSAVGDVSYAGKILKSQSGWENKGNGSDIYGFSALPAGDRGPKGDFYYDGAHAFFWSSTTSNRDDAYSMELNNHFDRADLDLSQKSYGFSVRCVKNE